LTVELGQAQVTVHCWQNLWHSRVRALHESFEIQNFTPSRRRNILLNTSEQIAAGSTMLRVDVRLSLSLPPQFRNIGRIELRERESGFRGAVSGRGYFHLCANGNIECCRVKRSSTTRNSDMVPTPCFDLYPAQSIQNCSCTSGKAPDSHPHDLIFSNIL
jgi:hypothetical protein